MGWVDAHMPWSSESIFSGQIGRWDSVVFIYAHPSLWQKKRVKRWDMDRHGREINEQFEMEMNLKHPGKFWNDRSGKWEKE